MKESFRKRFPATCVAIALMAFLGTATGATDEPAPVDALSASIAGLDAAVFDAFNHCDAPGQLKKHASYFARDVEFYHDNGGVTWSRHAMLANTRKYVCGHFSRELVAGSLKVYPVKDFGAIETGVHRFCQFKSGECEGMADFTIIWRKHGDQWRITRVLSYGHRANLTAQP